jgi:hypothetical protein
VEGESFSDVIISFNGFMDMILYQYNTTFPPKTVYGSRKAIPITGRGAV